MIFPLVSQFYIYIVFLFSCLFRIVCYVLGLSWGILCDYEIFAKISCKH